MRSDDHARGASKFKLKNEIHTNLLRNLNCKYKYFGAIKVVRPQMNTRNILLRSTMMALRCGVVTKPMEITIKISSKQIIWS